MAPPLHPGPPVPSAASAAGRSHRPPSSSRDVSARTILFRLRPRAFEPALGPLHSRELTVLQCHGLDELLLARTGMITMPRDLLRTAGARARALASVVPDGGIISGESAIWVHLGGEPPRTIHVAHPDQSRPHPGNRLLPHADTTGGGRNRRQHALRHTCTRGVDVARTAPPVRAVESVLRPAMPA